MLFAAPHDRRRAFCLHQLFGKMMSKGCFGVFAIGLCLAVGCGGNGFPDPVPVSGKVTYQGKPVEGAQVTFLSQTGGRSANGRTDASGAYKLTTFNTEDGAIPDEYTVTIAKIEAGASGESIDATGDEMGADYGAMMDSAAASAATGDDIDSRLPARYANPAESGLARTVAEGQPNEFNFDLE